MKAKSSPNVLRITVLAMLAALAVAVGLFKFPLFPAASFLEFDFADVPILLATLLYGPIPGLAALFTVSAIQAFFLGGNGIIGFLMHFIASGAVVVLFGIVCRNKKSAARLTVSSVCGTLLMTALMVPINYIAIPLLFGAPREMVTDFLPFIIPFNLIKAGVNTALASVCWFPANKALSR